jgi:hypothetical protein
MRLKHFLSRNDKYRPKCLWILLNSISFLHISGLSSNCHDIRASEGSSRRPQAERQMKIKGSALNSRRAIVPGYNFCRDKLRGFGVNYDEAKGE